LSEFLAGRGLSLSEAKTRIVHIGDGFNFLGFNIRRFPNGKLLTQPQKEKATAHRRRLSQFLRAHRQLPTAEVIRALAPVIRGWCNYYRHGVSKRIFSALDNYVWTIAYKWAKRRHPNKSRSWVVHRYFGIDHGRGWVLCAGGSQLPQHGAVRVPRHVKVKGQASPFDPSLRHYWEDRRKHRLLRETARVNRVRLLKQQDGRCGVCRAVFDEDALEERGIITLNRRDPATATTSPILVHRWCRPGRVPRGTSMMLADA
jgi:RNA-directed DNA polymerase